MPQVSITLAQGRTPEQIRAVLREVHAAVLRTTDTRSEHIRVVVHEVPRTHWATGDITLTEMDAAGAPRPGTTPDEHTGRDGSRPQATAAQEEQS